MIEARNLTKTYGPNRGVRDITFRIESGDVVGLLGPNGAGKSTTIKMLTGYLPPTSGVALVGGFDTLTRSIDARRRIGYLPENAPIYPELRVEEYLRYRAALKEVPSSARKSKINLAIARCRLEPVRKRISGHLSKGYKQRLALAGALVADPPILILDEPTVGLDPNQVFEMRALIRELSENRTIFLSTHILPEVEAVCSRVLVINEGSLVADEPIGRLLRNASGERQRVRVLVRGGGPALEKAVAALDGIEAFTAEASPEPGCIRYKMEMREGVDARDAIVRTIINSGAALLELESTRASLEEVFGNLTRLDPASRAAGAA
ncbi:MAG: ABC transporter ATP-binding protein [Planctomycetes bacterium]|nr:ABC transporter ATP-binding protein [Planctomycetota bacterium]